MARAAIITFELAAPGGLAGGVGTFTLNWARLLHEAGDDVTVIVAPIWQTTPVSDRVRDALRQQGIAFTGFPKPEPQENRSPFLPALELSEQIAAALAGFDVAYFPDAGGLAIVPLRQARLPGSRLPICVTVTHGPLKWARLASQTWDPGGIHPELEFQDRYVLENSHWLASPSTYMLDWARRQGWKLAERQRTLGLPWLPPPGVSSAPVAAPIEPARHVIYFGRLEPRKGFALFERALLQLDPETAARIERVTFLGAADLVRAANPAETMDRLRRPGWTVEHIAGLDTGGAHRFLREHAATGIVVTPSLPDGDNFPFTVLETTLAGGIRLLASRIGGIPEILGPEGDSCLFEPAPEALAAKIAECMRSPDAARPQPYDCQASNQRWLAFHQEVLASRTPPVSLSARPAAAQLDVCIPYFNMARTFGQTLESLARQTCRHFKVFAIDDGSTDPAARAEFDKLADLYANRGWTFFRTGNGWVDAARNRAAARGQGKYLLFLDADDVLPPQALDRLLECIEATGDDCLIPAMRGFTGDASPLNGAGDIVAPAVRWMMPLGPALTAAIGNPAVLGGPVAILRRAAFEAIGGYRERRLVNEDWELLVRLRLRGYRVEVIPEYLHLYRMDGAGLSTTKDPGEPPLRLLEASEETLGPLGLQDLPALLWAHHRKAVSPPWDAQALRYGKEVQAPAFLRPLQMFYRQALPPAWRLRIHELVLRPLIRIRRSLP